MERARGRDTDREESSRARGPRELRSGQQLLAAARVRRPKTRCGEEGEPEKRLVSHLRCRSNRRPRRGGGEHRDRRIGEEEGR